MAELHPKIAELLGQFNENVRRAATPPEQRVHNVDQCAREPFPDCGKCLSLLDPLAIHLIAVLADPDAPRA